MKLQINGEERLTEADTVLSLLQSLEKHPKMVVVEFNGEILPREHYQSQQLQEGDALEIVQMMAGG
jgi:sulfur carrier protein